MQKFKSDNCGFVVSNDQVFYTINFDMQNEEIEEMHRQATDLVYRIRLDTKVTGYSKV